MKIEILRYDFRGDRIGRIDVESTSDDDLLVVRAMLRTVARRAIDIGEECMCHVYIGESRWSHVFSVRNARVNHIGEDAAYEEAVKAIAAFTFVGA